MAKRPLDLATARILLSNDDGIDAPGMKLLERIMRRLATDVWVVAPETEQSAAGHSLTLRRPLRIRRRSARRFAVDGTPTDAVLLGVREVMKDHPPDLVVSGINRGGNMGEDVTYSGTVAAAMEATLLGIPAIALSQAVGTGKRPHWSTAERYTPEILDRLVRASWPSNVLINVNFPDRVAGDVQGYRVVSQGRRKPGGTIVEGSDPAGRPYYWIGSMRDYEEIRPGTDLEATSDGAIAVTPLHLDLTHRPTVQDLKDAIE